MFIIEPGFGDQACGDIGEGRLAEPLEIAKQAAGVFTSSLLSGKNILITLGGTKESIDPVRFISNHSSGKMGMALAHACIQAGAKTTLIVGSISVELEKRAEIVHVVSAEDMYKAVMKRIDSQDLFISCAAVADFKPKTMSQNKIKKNDQSMTIELIENKDILASVCQLEKKPICIGFAAETENHIENAKIKLKNKKCDAILLNDVSKVGIGLNSDDNEVHLITKNNTEKLEKNTKHIIAEKIINKLENYFFISS